MYRKYMHKYIFASIDWDINISIDFSLPNLKLSRLWRHGADLLRCTVTSPASWSKFQKWRTWESHASSIIFTVRNRLNRTESFQMTEKLIQWKKTSSETRAHSQISHSHSILGGQIFKQILSISFPRGPPEKTSGVSFLASIHEYVDGAILQCNGHLFAVRPLEGAQDLTHGRLSGRPLAVSVRFKGNFELENPYEIPQNRTSLGIKFAKKDMVSIDKGLDIFFTSLLTACVWVVNWAWASMRWPGLVRPAWSRLFRCQLGDQIFDQKFCCKNSLAAVNVTGKVATPGEQWEMESSRTYAQNPYVVLKEEWLLEVMCPKQGLSVIKYCSRHQLYF